MLNLFDQIVCYPMEWYIHSFHHKYDVNLLNVNVANHNYFDDQIYQ